MKKLLRDLRTRLFRPINAHLDAMDAHLDGVAHEVQLAHAMAGANANELRLLRNAVASIQAQAARDAGSLRDSEFKAYSQFGEDGAIQWLLARVPVANRTFVEFGVGDYAESNSRFLLEHNNWTGLIMDAGAEHIEFIRKMGLAWEFTLEARSVFITAENIDDLLNEQLVDTGLLSVDIDGVDYWVLAAITRVRPRIIVCEYNSLFGPTATVTVPYRPDFDRRAAHPSMLYFGASISAFQHWAAQNGYRLVGSSAQGVNAFLVRDDVAQGLPSLTGEEAWVETRIRQARDGDGQLTYVGGMVDQRRLIAAMPLIDVATGAELSVADLESP